MRGPRRIVLCAAVVLLVAGCGSSSVRDFLDGRYQLDRTDAGATYYRSDDPVGTTTAAIVDDNEPASRRADGGSEYLRYDDDIVIVSPATRGSTVKVEDLDGNYNAGHYTYLGPGFTPGSPAAGNSSGGSGNAK